MRLPRAFYARDALVVAPELLGKLLVRGDLRLRITEVEAYPPGDTASHCRAGRTKRTAPMWGPPGHAYVYLCYGIHSLLNVVTNEDGVGAAVLIRSCETLDGDAIAGPGKVGKRLALDTSWSGHALFAAGGLTIVDAPSPRSLRVGRRVGIDHAEPRDRDAHWRFAAGDTKAVSHVPGLK